MTAKQRAWYLREWSSAFRAHWAGVRHGEAVARPDRPEHAPLRERVLAAARQLAMRAADGRLSPDLLRKGAHVVALGSPVSSKRMTNRQLDVVVAFFRLLAGQPDLVAQMQVDAAESSRERADEARAEAEATGTVPAWEATRSGADRKRMLWSLDHLPLAPAYLANLARDRFGTANWKSLDDVRLQQFLMQAKARALAQVASRPASSAAHVGLSPVTP